MTLPAFAPLDLLGLDNGRLPATVLVSVTDGRLVDQAHHLAARNWVALRAHAARDNVDLRFTDAYRDYARQLSLFYERWEPVSYLVWLATPSNRRRTWNGQRWRLKPGKAPSATPGNSTHGAGLSFDLAVELDGDVQAESLDAATIAWLRATAPLYGFVEDVSGEPWHWTYQAAEDIPAATLAYEASLQPPIDEEDDVRRIELDIPCKAEGKGEAVLWLEPTDLIAVIAPTAFGAVPQVGCRADTRPDGGRQLIVAVEDWFPPSDQVPIPVCRVTVIARGSAA